MTKAEQITDFRLEEPNGKPVTLGAIVKAVEEFCKVQLDGERFHNRSDWESKEQPPKRLPKHWRSLIAFPVDGDSEGYYVHIGVMVCFGDLQQPGSYIDMGFVKLWDAGTAYTVAAEAQRFLSAVRWN
jgi:hypothetical protein